MGRLQGTARVSASVFLFFLAVSSSAWAQFESRATVPTGRVPTSIAVGDFDHDNKLDLAVVAAGSDRVQVFLGNGDGTFRAFVSYPNPAGPFSIAASDLNHDGNLDLVVADGQSTVSVLLGDGDGTFQSARNIKITASPNFVAVGDLNGDHKPDLVILDSPYITVMLGNDDGTFQPPMDISTPYSPFALGVGDFNGDGKLDLAVGGQRLDNPFEVEILLGNGDGTFQEGADYALPAFAESISVADFRGSGKLDLAIATEFGAVPVFLGNGDGTFESPTLYFPPAFTSNWVTAADFDGDGIIDIAVANFLGPPGISVFLGDGDGTFRPATMYHAGSEPRFVAAADFNGDHKTDLVATDYLFNHINVLLNTGVVGFSPMTPVKFSPQLLNTTSSPQAVILTNRGASTLSISSISVQGQFSLNSGTTCSTSVAPGASCAISVAFKPLAIGNKNGTVTILDTASSKPQVIELTGAGTVVSLSPAQLNFPPQKVGGKSAPLHVTVTNEGTTSITFSSINLDGTNWGDFSEINTCTAQQLQAGASCTVTVTFSPTKTGQRTATVFIYDDGGGTVQSVVLTGRGT